MTRQADPVDRIQGAQVRIYAVDGKAVIGSGFLVGRREVVTCAHVVTHALGLSDDPPEPPPGSIFLDFPLLAPGQHLTARVARWHPQDDIAVLELESDPPEGAEPAPLVKGGDLWGHPIRAFGFPDKHPKGVWASGIIRGPIDCGWLQIEGTKEISYWVKPGFSGAPVWDDALGGVVGMVAAAESDPSVKAAFIIPTALLSRTLPSLAPAPRSTSDVPNPFCDRGRINDPARLFDRERILRELRDLLAGSNSVSLVGEPQIGKSSVLYALYRTAHEWFPDGVVLYVDLQGVLSTEDFCVEVLEGLGEPPGRPARPQARPAPQAPGALAG